MACGGRNVPTRNVPTLVTVDFEAKEETDGDFEAK